MDSGFFGGAGKAQAFPGPLLFGVVWRQIGSQRPPLPSVSAFFVVGMILLALADEERGKSARIGVKRASHAGRP